MSKRKRHRVQTDITVGVACQLLETVFSGGVRGEILDAVQGTDDVERSFTRLRSAMRSHVFPTAGTSIALGRLVHALDARTRNDGFHVLQSWDYQAQRFADHIVPVLLLDRCAPAAMRAEQHGALSDALSVLLDQYFLSILGLLAVRAWDNDDADAVLERVTQLVRALHGSDVEGRRFVDNAETLLLLAVSHYHPADAAYASLLERLRTLDATHRLKLALACGPVLGSHLRWGLRFMYKRDVALLRDDNVVDYPWLLFSMITLVHAYERTGHGSASPGSDADVVEALLNGFSADPWAFLGSAPRCLHACRSEHAELRDYLHDRRGELLGEFQIRGPAPNRYSPLGLGFNFLCNVTVAMAAVAVGDAAPHPSLNALLGSPHPAGASADTMRSYANTLMTYACGREHRRDLPAVLVYDPCDAQHAFNRAVQVLNGP